ncbi:MAG: hypothetical protein LBQ66_11010 [Planctomycetaceae bacterium]|nr:hypothetical protein [Planctomycetaceae bacterium]
MLMCVADFVWSVCVKCCNVLYVLVFLAWDKRELCGGCELVIGFRFVRSLFSMQFSVKLFRD